MSLPQHSTCPSLLLAGRRPSAPPRWLSPALSPWSPSALSPSAALGYSVELGRTPLFRKNALHLLRPHQLAPRFPAPLRGSVS